MRIEKRRPTAVINIHICGDCHTLHKVLHQYCETGFCVSVFPCDYIYTGGGESGWAVRLINYPRFPESVESLKDRAVDIAERLLSALDQASCSIVCPDETIYIQVKPKT